MKRNLFLLERKFLLLTNNCIIFLFLLEQKFLLLTNNFLIDFFLISQHVRQGTVSHTHYVIVYDSLEWPTDRMQMISYKMTHQYYNWPGKFLKLNNCNSAVITNIISHYIY